MQDVLEQASVFIESTQHRHQAADASIPLNLQKLNLGRRSTGNNREGDKRYRRSLDEESRRPSSPARHRSQEGRGLFLGPNGAKNWRESPLNNDKQAWDENESPRHPSARTSNSQASNPLYKTRLCERYETEAHCPYGNRCTFAHGTVELRERPLVNDEVDKKDGPGSPLYKTRLCERFVKEGFCQYGPRCNFAHSELRERPNHAREGEKDNIQKEPIQQAPAPLKTKANGDVSHTATRSRTAPSTEPHPDTPAKVEVINNTKAPITASSTPPTPTSRGHLRDKSSLKDLLSGDDKSKPWMRIVELSDEERGNLNNSSPHPPPPPRAPLHPADEKANLLEEKLSQELARFINPGRLSVNEEIKEVTRMEFKHDLSKRQVFAVLLGALLLDSTYESAKIVNRVKLFQQFIRSRQDQVAFLKVWEKQVLRTRGLLSKVPLICKDLYDTDLVEEDTFLEWYRGIGSDELKKKAAPFVLWLQTAEEEEED
ncbi:uncharacterized protein SPPG_03989 [Spizellomyces punctatus DAOM BR117]|uniref:C3H1-type domain-containing protein n=1 Tax=Spizellomyces punctatus (strain DAOM BR117) TaxID=645134 RepID=A0A0L0HJ75_SPIPD|nr:uncharacterized protein SPPG_03989 [Spizellomyces punctatus DAOM BR117]KND00889.1 hypothetical protein SPPG_03989 [Spizellomyces punctatus DAOM BR117]|eukprot:XP_016608928.1 hypothetical protein SPPG_03989 [Spizellomyces punctatus DAOM BR117]